jgi:hypothetical protein
MFPCRGMHYFAPLVLLDLLHNDSKISNAVPPDVFPVKLADNGRNSLKNVVASFTGVPLAPIDFR